MDRLRGCAKMVANMLERDSTPVRKEAAQELLDCVARVDLQMQSFKENLKLLRTQTLMEGD